MNKGIATSTCKTTSGGVTKAPTINKIKYAYFLIFRKNVGVKIPKLVKNIMIIGISNKIANGMVTLNKNLKYFSTVNNSLNIPSFKFNKNGKINLINMKYPNTRPVTNNKKIAGIYDNDALLSRFVNPGLINNQSCKLSTGNVATIAINPAMVK